MKNLSRNQFISYSKPFINVVCYILITFYLDIHVYAITLPYNAKFPAFLALGDSILDVGNNNYIASIGKADFPPYGRDFKGGVPTGRFSNGKIPPDFFAEEFGIKELVPPYLDPTLHISDLLTGVSFASASSGYDPESPKLLNALSFDDQLNLFKNYISKLNAAVGENTTSTIISQSFYLVCAGSNDFTQTYFLLPFRRKQYDISSYTDFIVNRASTTIQGLYSLGARRIGVTGAPPCGCLPAQRTLVGGLLRECVEEENQAVILYNKKLYSEIKSLNQKLPGSKIVYLDIYTPLLDIITNPTQYGFEIADRGCCGSGKIEVTVLCNKLDPGTCSDVSKYVFFDSFHPTEATYKILVHEVLRKSINDFF